MPGSGSLCAYVAYLTLLLSLFSYILSPSLHHTRSPSFSSSFSGPRCLSLRLSHASAPCQRQVKMAGWQDEWRRREVEITVGAKGRPDGANVSQSDVHQ